MPQRAQAAAPAPPEIDAEPTARRARWGTISREDIIRAAVTTVRAGRYEEMTIRSLAAELGVSPMSLYRNARNLRGPGFRVLGIFRLVSSGLGWLVRAADGDGALGVL